MKKVLPTQMQYAGITTRAPWMRCVNRSAIRPPSSTPGMPPRMHDATDGGRRLLLRHPREPLVELRAATRRCRRR